jgi:hypothetical protein
MNDQPPERPSKPNGRRARAALIALLLAASTTGVVWIGRHNGPVSGTLSDQKTAGAIGGLQPGAPTVPASATPSAAPSEPVSTAPSAPSPTPSTAPATVPEPGVDEHATRLLPLPSPPPGTGGYALLPSDSQPARYDPCRPIHYVVRDKNTPYGGDEAISAAVAEVSKATGLQFIDDGKTTEPPNWNRSLYQPNRYGDRWAPVLIAWTDPTESPDIGDNVAGLAGSQSFTPRVDEPPVYVSGQIQLDVTDFNRMQTEWHGDVLETELIEHELGHLVGLDHVMDPTQIMNPGVTTLDGYGAGDLRGLAYAGGGGCHPEI